MTHPNHAVVTGALFSAACDHFFAAGTPVLDIAAALGISRRTYYKYRAGQWIINPVMVSRLLAAAQAHRAGFEMAEEALEALADPHGDLAPGVSADPAI